MASNYYDQIFDRMQLMDNLAECEENIKVLNRAEDSLSGIESKLAPFEGAVSAICNDIDQKEYNTVLEEAETLQNTDLDRIRQRLVNLGNSPVYDSELKKEVDSFIARVYDYYPPSSLASVPSTCDDFQRRINSSNDDIQTKKKELIKKIVIGILCAAALVLLIVFIANNPWVLLIPLGIGIIVFIIKKNN